MQLEKRDKRALILGAVIVMALLYWLLRPSSSDPSSVELVAADQRPAGAAPPPVTPPPVMSPTPLQTPPSIVAAPAASGPVPEGLTLHGVTGAGAIFGFSDGSQRYVPRGRDIVPGVKLQAMTVRHVILATPTTAYRLGFGGVASAIQAPPAAPQAVGGSAPALVVSGAGRNPMGGPAITQEQHQRLSQQFVQGLEPRRVGGRITGWTVKPGASLMALGQAGMQPGDVLLTINGEAIEDAEQIAGLSQQIANSSRVEFGFERNGQRMTRALQVNQGR